MDGLPYSVVEQKPLPDGRTEVTYAFGPADRQTVIIPRTDNLPATIANVGVTLAVTREG